MLEPEIEATLIAKLRELKYTYRPDIHDRAALERNFRQKFEALNRVQLTDNNSARHFSFDADERFLPVCQFADEANKKITHLESFAERFLAKCTLAEMLSRYMVLVASEQKLMMMRPYQIYAVKAIVACIDENDGNGYIWHTTGSGKTLTSFKAATLLKDNPAIEKCVFVVDRKDLDRQTREEFNRFQTGCVEENTTTESLARRLLSTDYADKVIVTTIQKLGLALNGASKRSHRDRLEALRHKRMTFICDECHRSQFGENHKAIKEFFPNAQLFGFTGTPIFAQNASYQQIEGQQASYVTTDDLFQRQLHAYTITHAIEDRNVLRFHIDYYKPEGAHLSPPGASLAKRAVVEAILDKHDAATAGRCFNNASEHFDKGKRQNRLLPEHIDKILTAYQFRREEERYARRVSMAEIAANDYTLNISRYISTAVVEEEINLAAVNAELVALEQQITAATRQHNAFLAELGLPPLP